MTLSLQTKPQGNLTEEEEQVDLCADQVQDERELALPGSQQLAATFFQETAPPDADDQTRCLIALGQTLGLPTEENGSGWLLETWTLASTTRT